MSAQTKITDQLGYLEVIKKALPKSQIEFVDNLDDINFGYRISPIPGDLIVFRININDQMRINVTRYSIRACHDPHVYNSQIYTGIIPANEQMEPDLDFVRQLVKNYRSIG